MTKECYDFPVSLHGIKTESGKEIPNQKALVREDTQQVLSIVSDNYKVVTHAEVIDKAKGVFYSLGKPEIKYNVSKNGANLVAMAEYKDVRSSMVGDTVGMRVFMENSYNKKKGVSFFIGGVVLSCLNGMVSSNTLDTFSFRHTKNQTIELPTLDDLQSAWYKQMDVWRGYQNMFVPKKDVRQILTRKLIGIMPAKDVNHIVQILKIQEEGEVNAWDMHQAITSNITHKNERLSEIGKIMRLKKVSFAFEKFLFPVREA